MFAHHGLHNRIAPQCFGRRQPFTFAVAADQASDFSLADDARLFLTTTVPKSETARTIAANNIVNSGFMVLATVILTGAVLLGVTVTESLLIVAFASIIAAYLAYKLHLACD